MSEVDHLPPGPFKYQTTAKLCDHDGRGHVYILDANGRKIAVCWGPPDTKLATADLIIKARTWADTPQGRDALKQDA